MKILNNIMKNNKEKIPVTMDDVDNLIKLVKLSKSIDCYFSVNLLLSSGNYTIDSNDLVDIKITQGKTQPERLIISTQESLLAIETAINITDIKLIQCNIEYKVFHVK